ncbi:MAG TPA: IS1595 family transposase [Candidatus Doudnabacteria bacterium]|nr:IS1595 family transposase [Candidatus Doudnabacteria bacterium]
MKYTIKDFDKQFPNNEACLEYLFKYRFGYEFPCPSCGKASWSKIKQRKAWSCAWCSYQIHPTANTIFHKSETDLKLWFFAIYKFSNSRNGVSSKELERDLGVTYKTAWRIGNKIRSLMDMSDLKLSGIVEVDESQMEKLKDPKNRRVPKVIGMVQRGGGAKAIVVENPKAFNTIPLIKNEVEVGSAVMTDMSGLYNNKKLTGYNHNAVNHSKKEYAFGLVHTNTVEGFFSQIKRSIDGTYHRVSPKYMQDYLNEFSFRLTHSRTPVPIFLVLLNRLSR